MSPSGVLKDGISLIAIRLVDLAYRDQRQPPCQAPSPFRESIMSSGSFTSAYSSELE